jgi:hypothetical protein
MRVCVAKIGSALRGYPRKTPPADFIGTLIAKTLFLFLQRLPHFLIGWVLFGVADGVSAAGKMKMCESV